MKRKNSLNTTKFHSFIPTVIEVQWSIICGGLKGLNIEISPSFKIFIKQFNLAAINVSIAFQILKELTLFK